MGTTARVIFQSEGQTIFNMRTQYDGYPDGVGMDLARIMAGGELVGGLGLDRTLGKNFNGAACLAASVIALMKKEPGNIYLYPPTQDIGANYTYYINVDDNNNISIEMTGGKSFVGTLDKFVQTFGTAEDKEKFLTVK
jgi:hypothetical protein